jgi:hypothetical protein
MNRSVVLLLGLSGCAVLDALEEPGPPNCSPRVAYYPDADGDGIGEPTDMYVGCEAPDGWATTVGSGDTDPLDTDPVDTDTGFDTDTDAG